ncbi:MAG: metalloregulator ArsR/SmtB family transcription factor [Bacteroidota bacterium]
MENEKFIIKVAKALSDRHRLLMLREIAQQGSLNCGQVQDLTLMSQPSVSLHLKLLTDCGLLEKEKTGKVVNLKLNHQAVEDFVTFFGKIVQEE